MTTKKPRHVSARTAKAKKVARKARKPAPKKAPHASAARAKNARPARTHASTRPASNGGAELVLENARLRATVDDLLRDKERLEDQLKTIEAECKRYFDQVVDVEVANTTVANLYVASLRLHMTVNRDAVLAAIHEIVINLVGSEELAIFEVGDDPRALTLVSSFGIDARPWQRVPFGAGIVGHAAESGELWIAKAEQSDVLRGPNEAHLTAAIPLVVEGRLTGLIAVFRLLGHKRALEEVDHDIFALLGTQAASALYCSTLASAPHLAAPATPKNALQKNA